MNYQSITVLLTSSPGSYQYTFRKFSRSTSAIHTGANLSKTNICFTWA
jgi:hypothetical protein